MDLKEIADTIEDAKKYAVCYIEVPAHANYEISWSHEPPAGVVTEEACNRNAGRLTGCGPMLIACLTD